ncbi:MAG: GNAT family N-acetyltransferase [Alcanivoracaceae bacterium]|nr:GNAT family N-acetyltransferase [Alcanivoracaceae bacterium]
MKIKLDDLKGGEVVSLLEEHYRDMLLHSPPESVHALDTRSLHCPSICFWSAWLDGKLAGCGALKELDKTHGEIKSMRTSLSFLRRGVAEKILIKIIAQAQSRGYTKLSLETGSMQVFIPARKLYEKFRFVYCPPFSDYVEDPNSVFMVKNF